MRSSEASGPAGAPSRTRARLGRMRPGREVALLVAGITVLAINLRTPITSLPPLFPELQTVMRLSSASIAVLASVPVLCFGVFSALAAPLSRRFGEERVLLVALLLLVGGLLLRGAAPGVLLFPGTVLASAAIAVMNVLLPSLIKRRRPEHAGLLIGAYLLTLTGGAVIGSLVAVPLFRAAGGAGWAVRLTLGLWALPAAAAALAWLPQIRYRTRPEGFGPGEADPGPEINASERLGGDVAAAPARVAAAPARVAVRRHALGWQVAAFMGVQSLVFYAALSWLPTMFRARGVSPGGAGGLLALMNVGNLVTAMLIPVVAHRVRDQRLLIVATAMASAAGLAGSFFAPVGSAVAWTLLLGFGEGSALALAIFFTVARAPDPVTSASLSGFVQGVGYLIATAGPLGIGFLHAATGGWKVPILVLLAVITLELWCGTLAGRDRTLCSG